MKISYVAIPATGKQTGQFLHPNGGQVVNGVGAIDPSPAGGSVNRPYLSGMTVLICANLRNLRTI